MTPGQHQCIRTDASVWVRALAAVMLYHAIYQPASAQVEGQGVPSRIARNDSARENNAAEAQARPVALIPPGTVIANKAPAGWTHLIDKSQPRMHYGDVDQVPKPVRDLSGMFFTAMVARVRPPDGQASTGYQLDEVAIAMGTRVGAKDMIITPATQKRLGAHLGLLSRLALERGYDRFKGVTVVARTSGMAIIDGPAMMVLGGRHRPVVLRYAVLVDPRTGQLETLMWAIGQDDQLAYQGIISDCEWLPPNQVEERLLHVDAREFSLGLITENAMAILHLCKGQMEFKFPPDLERIATAPRLTPQAALEFERRLWEILHSVAPSDLKPKRDS